MINKNTAYHEAGHFVAWTVLTGEPPHSVYVPMFGFMGGGVTQLYADPSKSVPAKLKNSHVMMVLAGATAQARFERRSFSSVWNSWCCESDREAVARLMPTLPPHFPDIACELVRAHWTSIEHVAACLLLTGGYLDGEDFAVWGIDSHATSPREIPSVLPDTLRAAA